MSGLLNSPYAGFDPERDPFIQSQPNLAQQGLLGQPNELMRGAVAGLLGLPGDIARMVPGSQHSLFGRLPTSERVGSLLGANTEAPDFQAGLIGSPDPADLARRGLLAINMFAATTPEFRKMFSRSKLVDESGRPDVLFHGSTGDIERFDLELANPESDWGRGIYLTNSVDDVNANYAGFGPDLTNRLQLEVERLEDAVDYDDALRSQIEDVLGKSVDDSDSVELDRALRSEAKKRFESTNEGQVTPLFAAVENPVVVGGSGETFFDIDVPYDEALDEFGEETGSLIDFFESIRDRASDYDDFDADQFISDVYEQAIGQGGISAQEIHGLASTSEGILYATDDTGQLVSKEIIRQAFEDMGFDGIIDRTVNEKFGTARRVGQVMEGVDEDTVHVVVFDPDKLNTAIGPRPAEGRGLSRDDAFISEDLLGPNASDDLIEEFAAEHLGLTDSFSEAGYIRRDGQMLDFSGKRHGGSSGVRQMDHRDVPFTAGTDSPTDDMLEFQKRTGAVRVDFNRGTISTNIRPNSQQLEVLEDGMWGKEVFIDFDDPNTGYTLVSTRLESPTKSDLRRFFNDAYGSIDDSEHLEYVKTVWGD